MHSIKPFQSFMEIVLMKIEMKFQYLLVKDKILLSCIFNTQKLKISEIFYYKNILSKPYILIKKQFLIKINFQKYKFDISNLFKKF